MKKSILFKPCIAMALSVCIASGATGSYFNTTVSLADTSYDMSDYASRLDEISKEQDKLDQQIADAEGDISKEEEEQEAITEKINSVNEKIQLMSNYITQLDEEIASQQVLVDTKQTEINQGIKDFKSRLRAMYLAGNDSYTDMILNSNDFYDVLMRLELVKRVASHDNDTITKLIDLHDEYVEAENKLDQQQTEYEKQYKELTSQKAELDELYGKSKAAQEEYENLKQSLEEQNDEYNQEREQFEADLSDILKGDYGDTADETQRMKTELAATEALDKLRDELTDSDDTDEYAATYDFAWPVPGNYYVTSGVGPRWGTTHKGVDIAGSSGTDICASDNGTVISTNNSCTHNYGKDASCGCGGGYGNFVIIDHGNGFITLYGHLTSADVKVGDKVKKGDVIGKMGTTGYSTGVHLHFELRYNGYYMNPLSFVKF